MALLLIIGPSGSGKSTLLRQLAKDSRIQVVPTWTTRPTRGDEIDDIEHQYVSDDVFDKQKFLAVVTMFGLPYRYGLPIFAEDEDHITVVMIRAPQVEKFRIGFPRAIVYQIETPLVSAQNHLTAREMDGETNGSRLEDYEKEMKFGHTLADRVFVNDNSLDRLYHDVTNALKKDFSQT